jgi:hypothetical protein
MSNKFIKHDTLKTRWHLFPLNALQEVMNVISFGAMKYKPNNWQKVDDINRYYDAALRHIFAWKNGEQEDSESYLHPLAHAACCLIFIISIELNRRVRGTCEKQG